MTKPTILETPCIVWPNAVDSRGYGRLLREGRNQRIHRWIWRLVTGDDLTPRDHIAHRCDNPPCFRFDHLFKTDHRGNMHDKATKGRHHNQSKTHCPQGHPYPAPSVGTERSCKVCHAEVERRARREGRR